MGLLIWQDHVPVARAQSVQSLIHTGVFALELEWTTPEHGVLWLCYQPIIGSCSSPWISCDAQTRTRTWTCNADSRIVLSCNEPPSTALWTLESDGNHAIATERDIGNYRKCSHVRLAGSSTSMSLLHTNANVVHSRAHWREDSTQWNHSHPPLPVWPLVFPCINRISLANT
jgi:hypothetical protein